MKANRISLLAIGVLFFGTLSAPALGYIDGGTGSMLLQAAVSGVLGALFVARSVFRAWPARLRRRRASAVAEEPERAKAA
jgi:hypothetical protein